MVNAITRLPKVGIAAPWDAGQKTIQAFLGAYLGKKTLDHAAFSKYIKLANPATPALYAAIQAVVTEQNGLSKRVVEVIHCGIESLKEAISRATSPEERKEVRQQILDLIRQARDEADRQRRFNRRVIHVLCGSGLFGMAILVGRVCPPAQRPIIAKGASLFGRAWHLASMQAFR